MSFKEKFSKLIAKFKHIFYIISIVWSYLSIALFVRYGFLYLSETNDKTMSALTFIISGVYFIFTTTMLLLNKKQNRVIKKSFKLIVNFFKLIMITTAIITLFKSPFSIESITSFIWKTNMIVWIIFSLVLEIIIFLIGRRFKQIASSFTQHKEQENQYVFDQEIE